ncbi:TPA: CpsD/CapB family tyrosine-protein kinase [Enterococcus faecalis]
MKKKEKIDLHKKNAALYSPETEQAEYFRTLKTNVEMLNIGREIKSLVVTSPTKNSGKTLISSNLAATYAQYKMKTLLIDLDLRKPSIRYSFPETKESLGLSGLLDSSRELTLEQMVVKIEDTSLYVLPVGSKITLPHVVINSITLKKIIEEAKAKFDIVIIDTPPLLSVTDALVISNLVDGSIMVVKNGYTKKQEMIKCHAMLSSNNNYLGVVYNMPDQTQNRYYYY